MKKSLVKIGLVVGIATSSLFGFTYEIKQGWQQLGAIKDFDDLKPFDDASCVEYLWHYDLDEPVNADKWKLHISDGKNYNYCGKTFSSLDKGDGFWLKASGECNITVSEPDNCPSNNMAPPTPPAFDESCDTNSSKPDNNSTTSGQSCTEPTLLGKAKDIVGKNFEISFDMTLNNTSGSQRPIGSEYWNDGFTIYLSSGRLNVFIGNGSPVVRLHSPNLLEAGVKVKVSLKKNGNLIQLFENGVIVDSSTSAIMDYKNDNDFWICADESTSISDAPIDGKIENLVIIKK